MTREKLIETLEDAGYAIKVDPNDTVHATNPDRAGILAEPTDRVINGWALHVGKNTLSDIDDAINFSKRRITR